MNLNNLYILIFMSIIMGFSIYLSWPFLLIKKLNTTVTKFLISIAIGILIFIVADIFSDVSTVLYSNSSLIGNFYASIIFILSLVLMFLILFLIEGSRFLKRTSLDQFNIKLPLMISTGMGLQNLTEGMILGSSWKMGSVSFSIVILVGFILQNFTEGFPIISPFIDKTGPSNGVIAIFYFIGGFPTIFGSLFGYYFFGKMIVVSIDGAALGAILFIIFPMIRSLVSNRNYANDVASIELGILAGFLMGLLVNLV